MTTEDEDIVEEGEDLDADELIEDDEDGLGEVVEEDSVDEVELN